MGANEGGLSIRAANKGSMESTRQSCFVRLDPPMFSQRDVHELVRFSGSFLAMPGQPAGQGAAFWFVTCGCDSAWGIWAKRDGALFQKSHWVGKTRQTERPSKRDTERVVCYVTHTTVFPKEPFPKRGK